MTKFSEEIKELADQELLRRLRDKPDRFTDSVLLRLVLVGSKQPDPESETVDNFKESIASSGLPVERQKELFRQGIELFSKTGKDTSELQDQLDKLERDNPG